MYAPDVKKLVKKEAKKQAKTAMKEISTKILAYGEDKIKAALNTIITSAINGAELQAALATAKATLSSSVPTAADIEKELVDKIIGALKKMKDM
jgi:predicted Ser/Thr protein kinase